MALLHWIDNTRRHPSAILLVVQLAGMLLYPFVEGTDAGDLSKGPGHYTQTTVPGLGRTVAIAGHRTTFGAWFRHIDSLGYDGWIGCEYKPRATTVEGLGWRHALTQQQ